MQGINAPSKIDMYRMIGLDIWHFSTPLKYVGEQRYYKGRLKADYWGIAQESYADGDSSVQCPLAEVSSVDEVESYKWPDVKDFDGSDFITQLPLYDEFAIDAGLWAPIFHNLTWLCGFETTLINLKLEPEVSKALIRHITDFWIGYLKKLMDCANGRIDIVQNCNDFGAQQGLIMNAETFREFFKPELKRIYDVIKSYGAKVMQHSCGSIEPVIADFIEIGMDILNPVQVSAFGMEPELIAERYGDKVTFYGGIDTQHVLPEGPAERIREETRRALRTLGRHNGFILAPSQGVEADISVANLLTMFDEGRQYAHCTG